MEKRYIAHKKSFIKLSTALLFVSSVFLMSCKQVLLPQPGGFDQSKNSSGSITTEWTAPTDLKVTQGLQGRIELTWKPVLNAVRYFMYRSDTPFGNFVQVGETTDALYTQKVPAGTDTYYKITAVNLQNQETDYSVAVRGTSLAQPVISDIQGDAQEGDSTVTVYWYMNNVDAYADAVRYELVCYDATGKEQKRIPGESGNKTELTVTGLTPNTTYLYQVEAYNIAEQDKTEASDKIDAQTARRLRPNPPENLTVSQGAFGDKVEVSFVLPTKVDVAVEKNVYEQFPLYFKIYRKVAGEDDSTYEPVCGYFGSIKDNADENGGVCFVDTPTDPDAHYQEGKTVTWTDDTVVRGRQYQYKVQSYTDIESRVITSDKSIATSEPGWAVAPISFEMDPVIYDDEVGYGGNPVSHKTANLSATLTFDTLGKADSYTYELTVNYRRRNNEDGSLSESTPTKLGDFFTVDELSDHIYKADLHANPGSYSFTVNAKHKTSGWTESITTSNSRYVVPDLQPLIVQNLVVQDGYPGKFVLTWDRDPAITYEIRYKMKDAEGNFILIEPVLADEGAKPGQTQPFEYPLTHYDGSQGKNAVTSGDALRIEIVPYTDYQGDNHKAGNPESPDQLFYTLGTPTVTFDQAKAAADSITVTWPKIEKATSYEVTYAYDGVSDTTQVLRDGVATTFADAYKADTQIIPVTKEEEIQVTDDITCVIPKPIGYDYMAYSGKDVTVTVKAINETRKTETTKSATTRTLGPAATGVNATVATKENGIHVSWKEIPGATGYLIARTRYGATNTDDSRSTDGEFVYFYDTETQKLTIIGQDITPGSSVVSNKGTFTLSDTYSDSTNVAQDDPSRKFRIEQDKLGWGYPYRYQVFPVKDASASFTRSENLHQCTVGDVTYQDADKNYDTGSAIGYGLDVKATKAESADTVTVTWTKPYLTGTNLTPKIYRSELNSTSWTDCSSLYDGKLNSQSTNVELKASYEGANKTVPYKYIVTYSDSSLPNSTYQNLLESTKENGESINIGYYFAIENISVSKNKEVEEITIPRYNLQERKQGPDGYRLYLTNVDHNEGKEVLIGEFDKKLSEFTPDASLNGSIASSYTPDLISHKPTLKLTPIFDSATERHSGILNIDKGYKHSYRLEAYRSTENSETPVTTNVSDWGTRKLTYSEFLYLASKAINEGILASTSWQTHWNKWWTYTSADSNSIYSGKVLSRSSLGVGFWGFVFDNFITTKITYLTIDGRIGAETAGAGHWPRYYFTNMTGKVNGANKSDFFSDYSEHSHNQRIKISGPAELNGLFDGYISFTDTGRTDGGSIIVQFGENPSDSKTYTDGFVKWTTLIHE
ncbi:MAG: fibronectin type III domain-containing protein [Spirochaetia bacterium]|nr:fibronectin type III domain-containing protein [Spirochaetia bacterium]